MSRKSLIICLAVLAAMILGVGIAVALLYSGDGEQARKGNVVPDQERYLLLPAIPADAVLVACMDETEDAVSTLFSGLGFASALADTLEAGAFDGIASSKMAVSFHYNGELQPLYVFDAGKAAAEPSEDVSAFLAFAESVGMHTGYAGQMSRRSLAIVSESETLVKSSLRHLEKSISVMDAADFAEASSAVAGKNAAFFSNSHAKMLMSGIFAKQYASNHPFVAGMSKWIAAEITKADDSGIYIDMVPVLGDDPSEYLSVLSRSKQGTSKVAQILPSYTISAVALPMRDAAPYAEAYQAYMDTRQSLQSQRREQRNLETRTGVSPEEFFRKLDVKEVAKASFMVDGSVETVNLIRIGREDDVVFIGAEGVSFKGYEPAIHSWPFYDYVSSVFGSYFDLGVEGEAKKPKESCFTYIDGWIVAGRLKAVEEYVSGKALSYSLVEFMADAGQKDMLSSSDAAMVVYHSFTENSDGQANMFRKPFSEGLKPFYADCDYCPAVMMAACGKDGLKIKTKMPKLTMMRTKAPEFVRDTTVIVPEGPFKVKNSGTGKMNSFYQNSHGSLCLQDENGKGLWGVSFKGSLCGTAHNVDYYANGKLQILFGSGSNIYIIDRLGRFVSGFPVDLGKEILVGPDVYDFNDAKAYNIMVLHKDNTVEMYNLKGRKPSSWKSITAPETIKSLPERIIVGGNTFWVVRTAIQTLIYPFSGGTALTVFKGDQMIRPDSNIEILDNGSVKVECYDGKTRTVKLK